VLHSAKQFSVLHSAKLSYISRLIAHINSHNRLRYTYKALMLQLDLAHAHKYICDFDETGTQDPAVGYSGNLSVLHNVRTDMGTNQCVPQTLFSE
jgi:hypothetical protein